MRAFQSLLFVPGSRPDRFEKALASGADLVTIDLEDAVGPADKERSRAAALAAMGDERLGIRINGLRTREGLADLLAIAAAPVAPRFLMVPMVESAAEIEIVRAAIGTSVALLPLVETVRGVRAAASIAEAGIDGLMLGGADFAGALGVAMSWDALLAARTAAVLACAEARIAAIDAPWLALDDLEGLENEVARVRAMGFAAKALVHPRHVAVVHRVLRPSPAEVARAEAAEAAFAAAGGAAVRFDGEMLEAPVMARHRRILTLARRDGTQSR